MKQVQRIMIVLKEIFEGLVRAYIEQIKIKEKSILIKILFRIQIIKNLNIK